MRVVTLIALFIAPVALMAQEGKSGRVWEFTSYLHGTTQEVRDQLNGQLEKQLSKRAQTLAEIAECEKLIKARQDQAIETTRTLPNYLKLKAEKDQADADLKAARAAQATQKQLEASGRFNRARLAMEKMETDATTKFLDVIEAKDKLAELQSSRRRSDEAIKEATKWRDELLEALRNSLSLSGRLGPGAQGLIGRCTCEKIVDGSSLLATVSIPMDAGKVVSNKEGISTLSITIRSTPMLLTGVDTSKMKEGKEALIDRNFRVTEGKIVAERMVFAARVSENDVDELFQALLQLKIAKPEIPATKKTESGAR